MTTYKDSGVDIEKGDQASSGAGIICASTYKSRKGMKVVFGGPVLKEGTFSSALGFGNFNGYITQNSDGIGSKIKIAEALNKYDTLGYDLLAMVADDALCIGAETIYISNIIDIDQVAPHVTDEMLKGLAKACNESSVIMTGGEIAELPDTINGISWNASSIGVVGKDKVIDSKHVERGDVIVGLASNGFRSNGYTLLRHILEQEYGKRWYNKMFNGETWGEIALKPSVIYSNILLPIIGRFYDEVKVPVKGIAHITGGGYSNIHRALNGLQCVLESPLSPPEFMLELQDIGNVSTPEAYKTWNMGTGMMVILDKFYVDGFLNLINSESTIKAKIIGYVEDGVNSKYIARSFPKFKVGRRDYIF